MRVASRTASRRSCRTAPASCRRSTARCRPGPRPPSPSDRSPRSTRRTRPRSCCRAPIGSCPASRPACTSSSASSIRGCGSRSRCGRASRASRSRRSGREGEAVGGCPATCGVPPASHAVCSRHGLERPRPHRAPRPRRSDRLPAVRRGLRHRARPCARPARLERSRTPPAHPRRGADDPDPESAGHGRARSRIHRGRRPAGPGRAVRARVRLRRGVIACEGDRARGPPLEHVRELGRVGERRGLERGPRARARPAAAPDRAGDRAADAVAGHRGLHRVPHPPSARRGGSTVPALGAPRRRDLAAAARRAAAAHVERAEGVAVAAARLLRRRPDRAHVGLGARGGARGRRHRRPVRARVRERAAPRAPLVRRGARHRGARDPDPVPPGASGLPPARAALQPAARVAAAARRGFGRADRAGRELAQGDRRRLPGARVCRRAGGVPRAHLAERHRAEDRDRARHLRHAERRVAGPPERNAGDRHRAAHHVRDRAGLAAAVNDRERAPVKPLLVFDGNCAFCRRWVARWQRATRELVDYAPSAEAAPRLPDIPPERFREAVVFVDAGGGVSQGAEAVFRALAVVPGRAWPLGLYRRVPGVAPVAEWLYRWVARHRTPLSWWSERVWGPHLVPPGEPFPRWLYLRLLAVIYAIAFASLGVQVLGLLGRDGILPARDFLAAVHQRFGASGYGYVPSLLWVNAGDSALVALCVAGVALAALLFAGVAPALVLAGLWVAYLSLVSVGQDFLSFQWDSLLLEAGLVAILLAPWRLWSRPATDPPPPKPALWLSRWLVFRLMFSSAAAKLASGDSAWRDLTALTYHYETQCLPPWTAWFAHHLPLAFQRFSCGAMFVIEGAVPFLFVAPRRIRFAAAFVTIGFQLLIALTGNYGFFNWLTIALCVPLLDDGVWSRWRPVAPGAPAATRTPQWPARLVRPVAIVLLVLGLVPLFDVLGWPRRRLPPPPPLRGPGRSPPPGNAYGLFPGMPPGAAGRVAAGGAGRGGAGVASGGTPGAARRRRAFVAPSPPRLDWQMWFAALSDFRREPWFLELCRRLLGGSAPVLALLDANPFPGAPPRYLRAIVYDYHFTDATTRRATRAWWTRRPLGLYCPVLALADGELVAVPADSLGR